MTEEQGDKAFELYESLSSDIHELLTDVLAGQDPEVAQAVRDRLADEFRFWS